MIETYEKPPKTMLFWQCKQRKDKKECDYFNHKGNTNCHECKSKRDRGDIALDQYKHEVGILRKVEGAMEQWEHYEPSDTVQEEETVV